MRKAFPPHRSSNDGVSSKVLRLLEKSSYPTYWPVEWRRLASRSDDRGDELSRSRLATRSCRRPIYSEVDAQPKLNLPRIIGLRGNNSKGLRTLQAHGTSRVAGNTGIEEIHVVEDVKEF